MQLDLSTLLSRKKSLCKSFFKSNLTPSGKLNDFLPQPVEHDHDIRHARKIPFFKSHKNRFQKRFLPYCVRKWDAI